MRTVFFCLIVLVLLQGCEKPIETDKHSQFPTTLPIYVYHKKPPLLLAETSDSLTQSWFKLINRVQTDLHFEPIQIDRTALNERIKNNEPTIILWASLGWFESLNHDLLQSELLFWDAEILVSLASDPLDSMKVDSLLNQRYGLREGRVYPEIDRLVAQGKAKRIDVLDNQSNYKLLKRGKYDAYVDSRSTVLHQRHAEEFGNDVHIAAHALDAYSRHLIMTKHFEHQLPKIDAAIIALKASPRWQSLLQNMGLKDLVDPIELELSELHEFQIP